VTAGIRAVAVLDDELRRGMYAFIRAARRPVTRDEAAAAVGISRKLAAFHLDKLVAAGVLQADYQQARKVGRAPKVYRPVDTDIHVGIPPRQHELLADILLSAVLSDGAPTALRVAGERGRAIGAAERERLRPGRLGTERALTVAAALLERHGFECERPGPTCLRLRTCPFHPMASRAPGLVCGINQAFLAGVLDGLHATSIEAVIDSPVGACCVALRGS
jgi:predicted ArsR family transcriptional regulator